MSAHLPQQSLLDCLRPDTGWRTDVALVSTYSADPGVLASLLLSLAGHEDDPTDTGSRATRVKFAKSVLQLKGKVAIAMQAGRLFSSHKSGRPIALLDRFIKEIPWDERPKGGKSWHPKCAVVRYSNGSAAPGKWRFWLGSRNLTRDTSWDLGLSLDGYESSSDAQNGTAIPSIAGAVRKLAEATKQLDQWKEPIKRLTNVYWEVPRGFTVEEITLLVPNDSNRDFPSCPPGVRRLIAVAPFMDVATSTRIGRWGNDAQRILVSAQPELDRIAKGKEDCFEKRGFADVKSFLRVADEGEPDFDDAEEGGGDLESYRGLHAKLLWVEHAQGTTLWLGSPNLTERAWKRNAEIHARISLEPRGSAKSAAAAREGIESFLSMASAYSVSPQAQSEVEDDPLDLARTEVAARLMNAKQILSADWKSVEVVAEELPHPQNHKIVLKIGPVAGDNDQMVEWRRDSRTVKFNPQHPEAASHLLRVTLEYKEQQSAWLQSIRIDNLSQEKRDRLLFRHYLSDEQLLAWIYQALTGESEGAEGGPWDDDKPKSQASWRGRKRKHLVPTVEDILRAWLRNRAAFGEIREIMNIHDSNISRSDNHPAMELFKNSLSLIEDSLGPNSPP